MSRVKQLPSEHCGDMSEGGTYETMLKLTVAPEEYRSIWHFTRKDLEKNSMSLKDGIDWKRENDIRSLYCSFIQDLGIELKLPQFTIAAAIMFCHRFYLRQSHAKNNWQTVATACMFLASKVEETPCLLDKVVAVAYTMIHKKVPSVAQKIQSKEFFAKQKELIVIGERVVLATIGFDFNIQLPYKPLVVALKKLKLQKELMKMAWNFVNDWIRTTLCLQYKPHYIAAGSLYLAAKLNNVALPSQRGSVWWHEFDVVPQQLQEVIQQMLQHIGWNSSTNALCAQKKSNDPQLVAKQATSSSPASCVLSQDGSNSSSPATEVISGNGVLSVDKNLTSAVSISACHDLANDRTGSIARHQLSESPNCTVEDDTSALKQIARIKPSNDLGRESIPASVKLDVKRIRAMLKKRRRERNDKAVVTDESVEDMLEREIENEVGLQPSCEKVARTDENSQEEMKQPITD